MRSEYGIVNYTWRSLSDYNNTIIGNGETCQVMVRGYAEELIELTVTDQAGAIVDLSGMVSKDITLKKPNPDNTTVTKPAAFVTDGTDGKIEYKTTTTDLDVSGVWSAQGIVVDGAGDDNPTNIFKFAVLDRL